MKLLTTLLAVTLFSSAALAGATNGEIPLPQPAATPTPVATPAPTQSQPHALTGTSTTPSPRVYDTHHPMYNDKGRRL